MATQAQLDAIDAAIARGTLRVRYGEKDVTYHSMADLMAARRAIAAQIRLDADPDRAVPRHQLADFRDD